MRVCFVGVRTDGGGEVACVRRDLRTGVRRVLLPQAIRDDAAAQMAVCNFVQDCKIISDWRLPQALAGEAWLDIDMLALEHLIPCGLKDTSVRGICRFIGLQYPDEDPVSSIEHVLAIENIYMALLRAGTVKRLLWSGKEQLRQLERDGRADLQEWRALWRKISGG